MNKESELGLTILKSLHKEGVLKEIMLIGSWCLPVYKQYFNNSPLIPLLRTTDIDFMICNPPRLNIRVDVPRVLGLLGFAEHFDCVDGVIKYVHPDLEVEFVIPEIGVKKTTPFISELKITAQPLRFLSILQTYPLELDFQRIPVIVPEPAAFVIQKFLISDRRKTLGKKQKDLVMAVEFGRFLLIDDIQKERMATVVNELLPKWKKKLLRVMEVYSQEFYNDFVESLGLNT
jgi:hypothetical protein